MTTITFIQDNNPVNVYFHRWDVEQSVWDIDSNTVILTNTDWQAFKESKGNIKKVASILSDCRKVSKRELV